MYIGRDVDNISNVEKLDNITFDGSATYALTKSSVAYTPSGANNILISIDGVVQQGNFSVSSSNIVMDWSPTSSNTCDWILHIGVGLISTPADSSVTASKLGSLAVTGAKLNTDVISAQTELAVAPADADEFMVSDGGVLKRIDYSLIKAANTPAFHAQSSGTHDCGDQAYTVIRFNQVVFNVGGGTYDDTTNYDWTPGVAGKYWVGSSLRWNSTTNTVQQWRNQIRIDGTVTLDSGEYGADWGTNQCTGILTLTDANAISVQVYQNSGGTMATGDNDSQIWFAAFLLTGA